MKKILSLLLALTLILTTGVAFATDGETVTNPEDPAGNIFGNEEDNDWTSVKFKKAITTIENDGAVHPAETFNFTITSVSAVNEQGAAIASVPFDPHEFSIPVTEGAGDAVGTVLLPTFTSVGTYVYKVQESLSNTAGMVYDGAEYTFTVKVLNAGTGLKRLILKNETTGKKTDVFDNKYNAGSLVVNKKITGNYANFNETFDVKVTLTPEDGKKINSTIVALGNSDKVTNINVGTPDDNGVIVVTFTVTDGSVATINNIPYNTSYTVEEVGAQEENGKIKVKGYTATYDNNITGSIEAPSISTEIVNDLSQEIATGINLDNIPYFILLAGAVVGIGLLVVRKRNKIEY